MKSWAVLTGILLATASMVTAAPVYGTNTDIDLSDSRTATAGQILVGGNYDEDLVISWDVEDNGNGTWTYRYTFTGFGAPAISHFILDLTDDCAAAQLFATCVPSYTPDGFAITQNDENEDEVEPGSFGTGSSNHGFPSGSTIIGVKFNTDEWENGGTLEIISTRGPVWGDFYIKGGSTSYAYNTGLIDHDSENILDFIVRPNGEEITTDAIPEPGTFGLLGLALLGLGAARRFRR